VPIGVHSLLLKTEENNGKTHSNLANTQTRDLANKRLQHYLNKSPFRNKTELIFRFKKSNGQITNTQTIMILP
jgi:hypothetical protein